MANITNRPRHRDNSMAEQQRGESLGSDQFARLLDDLIAEFDEEEDDEQHAEPAASEGGDSGE